MTKFWEWNVNAFRALAKWKPCPTCMTQMVIEWNASRFVLPLPLYHTRWRCPSINHIMNNWLGKTSTYKLLGSSVAKMLKWRYYSPWHPTLGLMPGILTKEIRKMIRSSMRPFSDRMDADKPFPFFLTVRAQSYTSMPVLSVVLEQLERDFRFMDRDL